MNSQEIHALLVDQLIGLGPLVTGIMKGVVDEVGLTESQANLLWLIPPDAGPVPMKQLAARLHCDPSNVTLLAAKLEERGLARRAAHPDDGRVRTLVLTPAGRKIRQRLLTNAYTRSPFGTLTEKEQLQLHTLMAKALSGYAADRASRTLG
ncbi:MarR family transcriptional regulator [Kribbella sp. NBC_01505]|uniref:MarR family winged helix-turn-helix transcriptional regulator n=1 Tax=Kribbella sp. NBC_01505 TaxID=2903580 RepID=UPI003865E6EA